MGDSIFAPIQDELELVEVRLREAVKVDFAPLLDVFEALIGSGGKRFRPALAILASKFHPADPDKVITLAVVTERRNDHEGRFSVRFPRIRPHPIPWPLPSPRPWRGKGDWLVRS